jgi:hypothetical protein
MEDLKNINEQTAVISDDMQDRLRDYLNDDDFIEKLSSKLKNLEDGDITNILDLKISPKEFGILEDDVINIRVDKSDSDNPKFYLWIMSDKHLFDDVDLESAASILYQSGKGSSGIGYVGNLLGSLVGAGDAGDDGTDEESLMGVSGALAIISRNKGVDPKVYFDRLAKVFSEKYGESIDNFLETEFSGRAEVAALNTFRRDIPESIARGVNLPNILLDIATTMLTFGVGTAARAATKGISAGTKTLKYAKGADRAKKAAKASNVFSKAWNGLSKGIGVLRFKKSYPVGSTVKYITKGGQEIAATVTKYSGKGANTLVQLNNMTPVSISNLATNAGKAGGVSLSAMAPILPKTATAGMIAASGSKINPEGVNIAEIMGWYDTLTSDPDSYVKNISKKTTKDLAQMILDLKNGSGFWGNTTNQEELAMTLIITSLTPSGAKEVNNAYKKIDPASSVASVLEDELGGDMGDFAKSWWSACIGEPSDKAKSIKERISPSTSKK